MKIDPALAPASLTPALGRLWELSGAKIEAIARQHDPARGAPVFTVEGRYTSRGWTEWTDGFNHGAGFLQFDATGDAGFADRAETATVRFMAPHVSHVGVHDHGFNNLSTYGNWLRLQREGRRASSHVDFCELALKVSGAVQAARWSRLADGGGFIHSFNGPHSLFVDTIRSCRVLMVADRLGHRLMGENDVAHSLLDRALQHLDATAKYSVFYGEGRDHYDVRGRTAHEAIFNPTDRRYRCPNSQQGYSPFTTWTRGLAWALLGFSEQLEFMESRPAETFAGHGGVYRWRTMFRRAATATADWYIENTALDGVPYWDGGAPGLVHLGAWRERPAEPFNDHEPVDSSAAAIAAQGLLRLGRHFGENTADGRRYWQAGLSVMRTLVAEPYLSVSPTHQGLLLHSVYHRPNGWDHIPAGRKVPCGESSMWGDYHLREAALYLQRVIRGEPHLTFFGCCPP
jgi:hypothetical protein